MPNELHDDRHRALSGRTPADSDVDASGPTADGVCTRRGSETNNAANSATFITQSVSEASDDIGTDQGQTHRQPEPELDLNDTHDHLPSGSLPTPNNSSESTDPQYAHRKTASVPSLAGSEGVPVSSPVYASYFQQFQSSDDERCSSSEDGDTSSVRSVDGAVLLHGFQASRLMGPFTVAEASRPESGTIKFNLVPVGPSRADGSTSTTTSDDTTGRVSFLEQEPNPTQFAVSHADNVAPPSPPSRPSAGSQDLRLDSNTGDGTPSLHTPIAYEMTDSQRLLQRPANSESHTPVVHQFPVHGSTQPQLHAPELGAFFGIPDFVLGQQSEENLLPGSLAGVALHTRREAVHRARAPRVVGSDGNAPLLGAPAMSYPETGRENPPSGVEGAETDSDEASSVGSSDLEARVEACRLRASSVGSSDLEAGPVVRRVRTRSVSARREFIFSGPPPRFVTPSPPPQPVPTDTSIPDGSVVGVVDSSDHPIGGYRNGENSVNTPGVSGLTTGVLALPAGSGHQDEGAPNQPAPTHAEPSLFVGSGQGDDDASNQASSSAAAGNPTHDFEVTPVQIQCANILSQFFAERINRDMAMYLIAQALMADDRGKTLVTVVARTLGNYMDIIQSHFPAHRDPTPNGITIAENVAPSDSEAPVATALPVEDPAANKALSSGNRPSDAVAHPVVASSTSDPDLQECKRGLRLIIPPLHCPGVRGSTVGIAFIVECQRPDHIEKKLCSFEPITFDLAIGMGGTINVHTLGQA